MNVLFLGLNYAPEEIGIGPYSSGVAEALAEAGHRVDAVVGKPYYPMWEVSEGYEGRQPHGKLEKGVYVTRCSHYVPKRPTGAQRMLQQISLAMTMTIPVLRNALRRRPKVVISVAPALLTLPVAWLAARLFRVPLWLHVQDLEVGAALATGLIPPNGTTAKIGRFVERRLLKAADKVTTISPMMADALRDIGVKDECIEIRRNWAEIDGIDPLAQGTDFRTDWGLGNKHVVLYSGNIGNKQGLENLIDAARELQDRPDVAFVVCGNGPRRAVLEGLADGLPNMHFDNLQPAEQLGDLLGLASIHVMPQLAGLNGLMLPSKLANMMASGRPIVVGAEQGSDLAREVAECGVVVPPGDGAAIAEAVSALLADPEKCRRLGEAARKRAENVWGRPAILRDWVQTAEEFTQK